MDANDLLASPDPAIAYRAQRRLAGVPDDDPAQVRRRRQVAAGENVRRMLAHRSRTARSTTETPTASVPGRPRDGLPAPTASGRVRTGRWPAWPNSAIPAPIPPWCR